MFNRVPKSGSQSLMELILRLGRINNFITTKDPPKLHETVSLDGPMLNTLANDIINFIPPPYAYSQHVAYINFTDLSLPRPIYINLVRDPIERVISWHYYIRQNEYYQDMKKKHGDHAVKVPDQTFLDMDFETCVKTNSPYCRFVQNQVNGVGDHRRQMLFFCGQDKKKCLPFNSNGSLQRAKRVVEQEYAVVGVWEDTNITLSVLEHYIPKFFKYAKAAYYLEYDNLSNVNKNKMKRTVSNEVRELVRKNFTREIEFYEFCRQRLYRQYAAITTKLGDEDDYMLLPESL